MRHSPYSRPTTDNTTTNDSNSTLPTFTSGSILTDSNHNTLRQLHQRNNNTNTNSNNTNSKRTNTTSASLSRSFSFTKSTPGRQSKPKVQSTLRSFASGVTGGGGSGGVASGRQPTQLVDPPSLPFSTYGRSQPHKSTSRETSIVVESNVTSTSQLSDEQKKILDLVLNERRTLFFTGSAGSGKSFLLREMIQSLKKKYGPVAVAVTASTGIAACNIGGCTLHSFAGVGLGKDSVPTLCRKVNNNARAKARWLNTEVLILDEVSMIDGQLLDSIDQVAQFVRKNNRPFGGIQFIFCGDCCQLPPVGRDTKFFFESAVWSNAVNQSSVTLTKVFRQKDDRFVKLLNEMRLGQLSQESIERLQFLSRKPVYPDDGIVATMLYATRAEVDAANTRQLAALSGKSVMFKAIDSVSDDYKRKQLNDSCLCPEILELKVNCQVMLVKNIDATLVNGSLGRVLEFAEDGYPVVDFITPNGTRISKMPPQEWTIEVPGDRNPSSRLQVPLVLAWAMSIHKSQGQTLPRLCVDLTRIFESAQVYVALSRATSEETLQVINFDARKVKTHPKAIAFSRQLLLQAEKAD